MIITKDLENSLTLLEYDVAQHVTALASARAAVLDQSVIDALTQRVIAATQTLARSAAPQDYPATPAPVEAPVAFSVAPAPATPALPTFLSAPPSQPSVAESIAAALANAPK
ncbi:hypothetical protein HU230_0012505 [Bradyrhizobium quebecense]|uniref:Uncharacterized protein n=1 Tax=Bradyrhizobium quebecense TaxID=2748629 RepID=A0A973WN49_9BRAD|nr:hypothetical protein [Bradyrhizobium quebecense]UGA46810.1 hypothetical protein HU230_0012505 [Bradyrhizobium quebecense]